MMMMFVQTNYICNISLNFPNENPIKTIYGEFRNMIQFEKTKCVCVSVCIYLIVVIYRA